MYTYWVSSDAYDEGKGMRLDFMLVNAPLQSRVAAVGVDVEQRAREKPSDHAPMWISVAPEKAVSRSSKSRRRS